MQVWISRTCALGVLLASGPSAAACTASPAEVDEQALGAIQAFADGPSRAAAFDAARDAMREGAGCLTAPPTPQQAAHVHEAEALAAFKARDLDRATLALQAMRESDPTEPLAPGLDDPDGPIAQRRQAAEELPPSARVAVALPHGYALSVDGQLSATRPTERTAWVVVVAPDGGVYSSALLPPGGTPQLPAPSPVASATPASKTTPLPWFLAAGAVALTAGGLELVAQRGTRDVLTLQAAIQENADEDAVGMGYEEASALYDRTHALRIAAPVTAGVALGLGAVGVVVWRW